MAMAISDRDSRTRFILVFPQELCLLCTKMGGSPHTGHLTLNVFVISTKGFSHSLVAAEVNMRDCYLVATLHDL